MLLNLAHQRRRPVCDRAAVRILGVFESAELARAHAEERVPHDASIHALPIKTWTPIMKDEETTSPGAALAHLEKLGQRHRERIRAHADEFEANVSCRRTGEVHIDAPTEERCAAAAPPRVHGAGGPVTSLPISAEVRMQRFAIVSVISDTSRDSPLDQEPAFIVWEVCETEAEAQEVIKDRIARMVTDVHLDVVAMYEWLFPTCIDLNQVKEEYRDAKLDDLMRHRKEEHLRVAEFRKLCESRGQGAPLIDLSKESDPSQGDGAVELPPPEPQMMPPFGDLQKSEASP